MYVHSGETPDCDMITGYFYTASFSPSCNGGGRLWSENSFQAGLSSRVPFTGF